jgi:hypothetical protein
MFWLFCDIAALATIVSLYGWWFDASLGPAHGPGLEIGIIALAVALVAAAGAWIVETRQRRASQANEPSLDRRG